jgi:pimeloyl-ACP methyl ester carboxylesterase
MPALRRRLALLAVACLAPPFAHAQPPFDTTIVRIPRPPGRLEGTLITPRGVPRPSIVLLVGGAGPIDRNGNPVGAPGRHDALRQVAESLAVNGVASLRFDPRGIAQSASARIPEVELRFPLFLNDVVAWIDVLNRRSAFGPLFVAGYDEGALVGLLSAGALPAAGYIMLAAPSRNIADIMRDEITAEQPSAATEVDSILAALRDWRPVARLSLAMSTIFPVSIHNFLSSWMRYAPAAELSALNAPCLIVHGRHDAQIVPANADTLAKAQPGCLRAMIDSMTHTLKRGPADPAAQGPMYLDPTLPLAPGLITSVLDFIHLMTDPPPARCNGDAPDVEPRVLVGRPIELPRRASPSIVDGRYLGPFAAATLTGALVDSIATQQVISGEDAIRYGPTARKCGALLLRTYESHAADTAEIVAAVWKAETLRHRPLRTVLIDFTDTSRAVRAMSPLLRREIRRRGVAVNEQATVGDDTVRVVPGEVAFVRGGAGGDVATLAVRWRWTTRSRTGTTPCRITSSREAIYTVSRLGGAWRATDGAPDLPDVSSCVPMPPDPRVE